MNPSTMRPRHAGSTSGLYLSGSLHFLPIAEKHLQPCTETWGIAETSPVLAFDCSVLGPSK